jgi:hypothetical protein
MRERMTAGKATLADAIEAEAALASQIEAETERERSA